MKNKNKKSLFSTKEVAFLVVITCILSFTMAMLIFNRKDKKIKYVEDSNLSLFIEQYNYIIDNYYDNVDKEKLIDGAIMGMLYSLDDPYAEYYDSMSANSFNARLNGTFEGVGIEIIKLSDGTIYVLDVFEGSSAYEGGIKVGDIITKINDIDITTISQEEFLTIIKNSESKLKLKIKRGEEELSFELTKTKVNLKSVSSEIINDEYGYIKIDIFALNTYEQFKSALDKITSSNIKGLIIDLRGNPGGHLTTAENILSLLINKDKVIYQISNQGKNEKFYSKGTKDYKLPIVVLVDSDSASASELVASALMEQLNAIVIGQTTYGKGTVQELVDLPSGKQYKVTTKQWLTSLGKELEKNGVTPTIELTETDKESYINRAVEELKKYE